MRDPPGVYVLVSFSCYFLNALDKIGVKYGFSFFQLLPARRCQSTSGSKVLVSFSCYKNADDVMRLLQGGFSFFQLLH